MLELFVTQLFLSKELSIIVLLLGDKTKPSSEKKNCFVASRLFGYNHDIITILLFENLINM